METRPASYGHEYDANLLTPFIAYAIKHTPNYIYVCEHIIGMAICLQSMNELEQLYALSIFEKYYAISSRNSLENQSNFSRYLEQELSKVTELSEYD